MISIRLNRSTSAPYSVGAKWVAEYRSTFGPSQATSVVLKHAKTSTDALLGRKLLSIAIALFYGQRLVETRRERRSVYNETARQLVNQAAFDNYTNTPTSSASREILEGLSHKSLFENGVSDQSMADCCLSGLWLLHNFLHESHEICQSIKTPEGSFWHAIMHRLEGDFWNSKYWYRQAGNHPVYRIIGTDWNPETFVDACEESQSGAAQDRSELHQVACSEWQTLFEFCWHNAECAGS